jgi:ADP-ribose pyrophosphatase
MRIHASRRIYEGRVMTLRVDEVDKPRSEGRRTVEIVEHPGGAAIVAMPTPKEIILVRQYRYAVAQALWELPAGMIERGEDPALTAARELQEETGYTAERMRFLRSLYPTPGFCGERIHLFVAQGLCPGEQRQEDFEDIEVRVWSLEKAWDLVESDQLRDAKTQIGLSWAMMRELG